MLSLRVMKWVDHWLGLPLCVAASAVCALGRRRPLGEPRAIVVAKFFGLGSILLATPLVRALRARYPGSRIVFLTFADNRRFVELARSADEIWTVRQSAFGFFADTVRLAGRFLRLRPEAFLDLEFYSKYVTLLCALSGARVRVGFHLASFWRTGIYTHPVFFNHRIHITRVYAEMARQLGAEVSDRRPLKVEVPEEARQRLDDLYRRHGVRGPRIAVNVNASDLAFCRRWPAENFAALVERIVEESDATVILTGSASEASYTESCREKVEARYPGTGLQRRGW